MAALTAAPYRIATSEGEAIPCLILSIFQLSSVLILLRWLIEEEISSQLFVFVTSKVRLDNHIPLEAEAAELTLSANVDPWDIRYLLSRSPHALPR